MSMEQHMEQATLDEIVLNLEHDVGQLRVDVDALRRDMDSLKGDGDPTRHVVVIVSDLTKATANLTSAVARLTEEVRGHERQPHLSASQVFWRDVGKSVVSSLVTVIAVAMLTWMVLGARLALVTGR